MAKGLHVFREAGNTRALADHNVGCCMLCIFRLSILKGSRAARKVDPNKQGLPPRVVE